jgi:hypothetical protein
MEPRIETAIAYWRKHMWHIRVVAVALVSFMTVVGVAVAILVGVVAAYDNPNTTALNALWGLGWVFLVVGVIAGVILFMTRHAEKPLYFKLEISVPSKPKYESVPSVDGFDEWGMVLRDVWIVSASSEPVVLEFRLVGDEGCLGMRPYRSYYRKHQPALREYLSNTTHLVPWGNREGNLAFLWPDRRHFGVDSFTTLEIVIVATKECFVVPIPAKDHPVEGQLNLQSALDNQEHPTRTAS